MGLHGVWVATEPAIRWIDLGQDLGALRGEFGPDARPVIAQFLSCDRPPGLALNEHCEGDAARLGVPLATVRHVAQVPK